MVGPDSWFSKFEVKLTVVLIYLEMLSLLNTSELRVSSRQRWIQFGMKSLDCEFYLTLFRPDSRDFTNHYALSSDIEDQSNDCLHLDIWWVVSLLHSELWAC